MNGVSYKPYKWPKIHGNISPYLYVLTGACLCLSMYNWFSGAHLVSSAYLFFGSKGCDLIKKPSFHGQVDTISVNAAMSACECFDGIISLLGSVSNKLEGPPLVYMQIRYGCVQIIIM